MNKCLSCGKPVKNKYCNTFCQNLYQRDNRTIQINIRYGELKKFKVTCDKCKKEFEVVEREKSHPQKEKYHCSHSCANSHIRTEESKLKTSNTLKDIFLKSGLKHDDITKVCENCEKTFIVTWRKRKQRFCGIVCSKTFARSHINCRTAGLASAKSQQINRRSKNEIYLSELCKSYFKDVLVNENMFNGWDADIILTDEKIAILWNGKWHYEKITIKHSVEQVQNRDRIKIKEIKKMGYIPYIIKDMGKFNKEFVEKEFEKLKKYCGLEKLVISKVS